MSVSVRMPQLGESVTEGTVTRWLKKEGDLVNADEPLLEVSTDKVDTEIPSPASGVLRAISVAEEETVEVGAELAVIDEEGTRPSDAPARHHSAAHAQREQYPRTTAVSPLADVPTAKEQPARGQPAQGQPAQGHPAQAQPDWASLADTPPSAWPAESPSAGDSRMAGPASPAAGADSQASAPPGPRAAGTPPAAPPPSPSAQQQYAPPTPLPAGEGPYITPLVRKLAIEHGVDLGSVEGSGVGGRIRKQDVVEAARAMRPPQAATPASPPAPGSPAPVGAAPPPDAMSATAPSVAGPAGTAPAAPAPRRAAPPPVTAPAAPASPETASEPRPTIEPSPLRGRTEQMSRLRQVIAQRMVDSLHTSAQLTTVVEADVTKIARLRQRAMTDFERREGVRLSFLPFFTLATLEALKMHPKLNALVDTEKGEVTYYDVEHLGIAVDTDRGLLVPVIRNAGDLNIGGLARKIDDLARRTRSGQVSPDELSGGTFTLTNTGSRGAIFDTPIINQPQVAILGTGAVVKRPVVLDDPQLGEVIAVRCVAYLALTYDHRLVDGADAARFLTTVKTRLEEGTFDAELGL